MFSIKFRWLFVGMLCLALWPAQALTQQSTWEQHMLAGNTAYRQGKYKEAEKLWKAGLEAAESFGTQDPRYATSLNNLALLYQTQGRYAVVLTIRPRRLAMAGSISSSRWALNRERVPASSAPIIRE